MRFFRFLVGWWGTVPGVIPPTPASRTFVVEAESRVFVVDFEDRTFIV